MPDIKTLKRTSKDQFMIVACDGIWDCMSSEKACERFIAFESEMAGLNDSNTANIVEEILDDIIAPSTDEGIGTDNMTCILVYFKN